MFNGGIPARTCRAWWFEGVLIVGSWLFFHAVVRFTQTPGPLLHTIPRHRCKPWYFCLVYSQGRPLMTNASLLRTFTILTTHAPSRLMWGPTHGVGRKVTSTNVFSLTNSIRRPSWEWHSTRLVFHWWSLSWSWQRIPSFCFRNTSGAVDGGFQVVNICYISENCAFYLSCESVDQCSPQLHWGNLKRLT